MKQGRFFLKLFVGNALLLTLALCACFAAILPIFDEFYREELENQLRTIAETLRETTEQFFNPDGADRLDYLAKQITDEEDEGLRVTFILSSGVVLGDSEVDPENMESHRDRQEIKEALETGWGESTRWSHTVGRDMKYVACRVGSADAPAGVVRVSIGMRSVVAQAVAVRRLIIFTVLVVLVMAVLLALGLAWLWSRPISQITATARSLSEGNLSAQAQVSGADELALLGRSLNQMRDHLAGQLRTIDHQRLTLQHLLAQVHEGVVVTTPEGKLFLINPAAAKLLDIPCPADGSTAAMEGHHIDQCIPQADLREMLLPRMKHSQGDSSTATIQERRLKLDNAEAMITVLARAANIVLPAFNEPGSERHTPQSPLAGRLLVLTDITKLNSIIQMKSDFAANASHELRTPLSAIRAAVETLHTMDFTDDPEATQQIIGMIERQSNRLEAMVGDLLSLSNIESGTVDFTPSSIGVREIIRELRNRYSERIARKNLHWDSQVSTEDDTVTIRRSLLDLVLNNLLDNAIKFTPEGGRVGITAVLENEELRITVKDSGCGISPREQDRVFERFYQVERARTGMVPGTGLGLSIVRHAVNAMDGRVHLDSAPNVGTRITIAIPL